MPIRVPRMSNKANIDDLSDEIKDKANNIAAILISGNSAEIKQNKDGLLILEIKRKVVK